VPPDSSLDLTGLNLSDPIFLISSSGSHLPDLIFRNPAVGFVLIPGEPTPPEYAPGRQITHFLLLRAGYITDATGIKA
jgi:hypothetical protein